MSKHLVSSPPPPGWHLPKEELSHFARELVFPFLYFAYSLETKKWSKERKEGSHSTSQTEGKLLPKARQKLRNFPFHF